MDEPADRTESLMDRTGMGLLPGVGLALGLIVFAMAALLTKSMWAVVGVVLLIAVTTAALVYVIVAVADDGDEGARMRGRVPGLSDRL